MRKHAAMLLGPVIGALILALSAVGPEPVEGAESVALDEGDFTPVVHTQEVFDEEWALTVEAQAEDLADPSPASIDERICAAWPGDCAKALRVVGCESNFNPGAYNPAGPYYGLWQFDRPTWRSVGGSGAPFDASVEEQTERAWELRSRAGWGPWPVCGRR